MATDVHTISMYDIFGTSTWSSVYDHQVHKYSYIYSKQRTHTEREMQQLP